MDAVKTKERAQEKIPEKMTHYKMGCISPCYLRKRFPNKKLNVFQDMVKHVLDSLKKGKLLN